MVLGQKANVLSLLSHL